MCVCVLCDCTVHCVCACVFKCMKYVCSSPQAAPSTLGCRSTHSSPVHSASSRLSQGFSVSVPTLLFAGMKPRHRSSEAPRARQCRQVPHDPHDPVTTLPRTCHPRSSLADSYDITSPPPLQLPKQPRLQLKNASDQSVNCIQLSLTEYIQSEVSVGFCVFKLCVYVPLIFLFLGRVAEFYIFWPCEGISRPLLSKRCALVGWNTLLAHLICVLSLFLVFTVFDFFFSIYFIFLSLPATIKRFAVSSWHHHMLYPFSSKQSTLCFFFLAHNLFIHVTHTHKHAHAQTHTWALSSCMTLWVRVCWWSMFLLALTGQGLGRRPQASRYPQDPPPLWEHKPSPPSPPPSPTVASPPPLTPSSA